MEKLNMSTKAETLQNLLEVGLRSATILPLVHFSDREFADRSEEILELVLSQQWGDRPLIVRSSALGEDSATGSLAGKFVTVMNVTGREALNKAITSVFDSFPTKDAGHRVLVQPQLQGVRMSGVAFTRDPANGSPYFVINYELGEHTDAVTGGTSNDVEVFYCSKAIGDDFELETRLKEVIRLARELEELLDTDSLDIEFAFTADEKPVLFQVRPLIVEPDGIGLVEHRKLIEQISRKIDLNNRKHPYLAGDSVIYGVMPDWNPAEIIGTRPRPLALSLYRELITDAIWAYQRDNYGYRNLRSFPLMVDFFGLPYIDVRVSFNSFVPKGLEERLATRLVDYYLGRLRENPQLHDKVEFEIAISCYTFDFDRRVTRLRSAGFEDAELNALRESLKELTNDIFHSEQGLWKKDLDKVEKLKHRQEFILNSELDEVSQIYWLIEDCKRYGTLPFAGLARAGFIAVQLLESLVAVGVLTEAERIRFVGSLETVSSEMSRDLVRLSRPSFLEKYGHLRPGTYDIRVPRYDEAPDYYLDWGTGAPARHGSGNELFTLSLNQIRQIDQLLKTHGLQQDVIGLFGFIEAGIVGREYSKFVFTKSLSIVLSKIKKIGEQHGIPPEEMSFMQIGEFYRLYSGCGDALDSIRSSIEIGKKSFDRTKTLSLPPMLTCGKDAWAFHQPAALPNFITQKSARGHSLEFGKGENYEECILLIPSADPGFDWIFSTGLSGFITEYGGANSHMAIRAAELGIPAIIGAGTRQYSQWARSRFLEFDCMNKTVLVVQ